jgi:hypothetical protein
MPHTHVARRVVLQFIYFFRKKNNKSRPRDEYIRTILSPLSWGGAIELTILAAHYGIEIASIDVETGRVDTFGPGDGTGASGSRALLIYSGIHYDAAVLAPEPDAPQEFCASVVPAIGAEGERVLDALRALATKLREKRAYTNTATFDLRCEVSVPRGPLVFLVALWLMNGTFVRATRSADRGLRARRRRARTRPRRDMSSLANTDIVLMH